MLWQTRNPQTLLFATKQQYLSHTVIIQRLEETVKTLRITEFN